MPVAKADEPASRPSTPAALTAEWDVRGIDITSLALDPRGTVQGVPHAGGEKRTIVDPVGTLPPLLTQSSDNAAAQLEMGDRLGEGGMGVVWSARQTSLRREVAVKSTHPDAGLVVTHQLLQEARITGALEHPNIVPIHALGRDEDGRPLIIMKRLEGTNWDEELLQQHREGQGAALRALERHLGILLEVARATSFAHSHGIIHRDIKPGNVMMGSFGEVYLLDWGIAVSTQADDSDVFPMARDVHDVVGSPAYMAPEMAIGDGDSIDERTDVYLLGATLYEILTGQPPHDGKTPRVMLTNAFASAPKTFDAHIPVGLAQICNTAMQRDSELRYQTAAAFVSAINRYLEHQNSVTLADEASAKLDSLRDATKTVGHDTDTRRLYRLFDECRLGFTNALTIWPNNTRAREQLQTTIELMVGYELDHGSADVGAKLLSELPISHQRLSKRVELKLAQQKDEAVELKRLRRRVDPTAADKTRSWLSFAVGTSWALGHFVLAWLDSNTQYAVGPLELGALYSLYLVGLLASGFAAPDTLLARAASGLKMQLIGAMVYGSFTVLWPICWAVGMDVSQGLTVMFVLGAAVWGAGAVAVDRRLLATTGAFLLGLGLVLWSPARALWWMGGAGFLGAGLLGWLRARTHTAQQSAPLTDRWSQSMADEVADTLRDTNRRM
jgi:eukaryotic-like serine/threonine-protein kinase